MTVQIFEIVASGLLLTGAFAAAAIIARIGRSSRRLQQMEYREEFRKTWEQS